MTLQTITNIFGEPGPFLSSTTIEETKTYPKQQSLQEAMIKMDGRSLLAGSFVDPMDLIKNISVWPSVVSNSAWISGKKPCWIYKTDTISPSVPISKIKTVSPNICLSKNILAWLMKYQEGPSVTIPSKTSAPHQNDPIVPSKKFSKYSKNQKSFLQKGPIY